MYGTKTFYNLKKVFCLKKIFTSGILTVKIHQQKLYRIKYKPSCVQSQGKQFIAPP